MIKHIASYEKKTLNLSRKKNALSLLALLSAFRSAPIELVAETIWRAEYNPTYYDRIRMLVNRVNSELTELCSHPKIIQFENQEITLDPLFPWIRTTRIDDIVSEDRIRIS